MTTVLHFRLNLAHVSVDSMRGQVLNGAVQGTEHFSHISNDESYVRVPFEVRDKFKTQ